MRVLPLGASVMPAVWSSSSLAFKLFPKDASLPGGRWGGEQIRSATDRVSPCETTMFQDTTSGPRNEDKHVFLSQTLAFFFIWRERLGCTCSSKDRYQGEYRYRYCYQNLRDEINTFVSFPLQPLADYSNFLAAQYHKQRQQFVLHFCHFQLYFLHQ